MKKRTAAIASESIPHDLYFEILSRLPLKSLCRFRCVSKFWNTTISFRCLVKSHHNQTSNCSDNDDNEIDNTSLLVAFTQSYLRGRRAHYGKNEDPAAAYRLILSGKISQSLNGLIFVKQDMYTLRVVDPSSTHELFTLPVLRSDTVTRTSDVLFSEKFFGYDPVKDQHKVLVNVSVKCNDPVKEFIRESYVFVIGGGSSWRRVRNDVVTDEAYTDGICIDGILYYWAKLLDGDIDVVVAFDVRLETFRYIPTSCERLGEYGILMQYDGHLAIVQHDFRARNDVDLWVLEDSVLPKWVHKHIVFPSNWIDIVNEYEDLCFVGSLRRGDIVMASENMYKPYTLFYLNLKDASARIVDIGCLEYYNLLHIGSY